MESTAEENEKRLLATILKERLIEGRNTIIYKELLSKEIPTFLRNFLQNRVQKYFHTDEPFQIKNSKRYDFNYKRINELEQQLHKAFEEATLFTKKEVIEIINRTVGLQFDLLVAPHQTLTKIFYKNKSERTQAEILQILSGLADKRIFIQRLLESIKEFDQFHIVEEDFDKLSRKTQKEIYLNDFLAAFISDIEAFLDFVSHIKGTKEKSISKEIIRLLLTARNLEGYYEAFNSTNNNADWLEIHEVANILSKCIEKINTSVDEEYIEEVDDDIEDFIVSTVKTEKLEDVKPEIKKHFPKIEFSKDPQDFIIERSKIEYQPEGPFVSLHSLIDEKSKRLIQRKIFKKDKVAYNNFIKRLEEVDNWKEAKQIIDDELMIRTIQPFSREALKLGDLVFNRYFPKKS